MLTDKLESMTTTQNKVHSDNLGLKRSLRQRESEIQEMRRDTVPLATHNKLKKKLEELERSLTEKQEAHIKETGKLKKLSEKRKQELEQTRETLEATERELEEVRGKLDSTSQQIHSLQQDLQEKEKESANAHQTLQKLMKEEQEALEENRELKRELSLRDERQRTEKQVHDSQSASLQREKDGEIAEVRRELQEERSAVRGLQLDKESLSEQLKRVQKEVGGYQVRVREMEQVTENNNQEMMARERETHSKKVWALVNIL